MKEWDPAIEQAISRLGDSFDSHQLIQKIAHFNQRKYVLELSKIDTDRPFHKLHSAFGRRIKVVARNLGFTSKDTRSIDMFGQHSKCQSWTR
jgi:hypothetical protein